MKPTYSNDRTAPRMKKSKFSKMVVTKELHKKFIAEFPEYKGMSWSVFYQSWLKIAEKIRRDAITNPLGIKLNSYLGELKFQYLPYKYKALDHNTTEEVGEKINHVNIENKGKVGKIKWERRWAVKRNKMLQFYAFDETRELNRMAKDYIKANPNALRTSRICMRGFSVWRQKLNK